MGWWPLRWLRLLFTVGVYRPLLGMWMREFTVIGREHIPPHPAIFAVTHTSMADTPLLLLSLGARGDRVVVTAARDYFFRRSRPMLGVLVGVAFAAVPFDRVGFARRSLIAAHVWLTHGFSLVIYPHGTIPGNPAEAARLQRGVAALARASGCAVVPVYLTGAATLLAPGVHWPRRTAVRVTFLPPLRWETGESGEHGDTLDTFTARLTAAFS